MSKQKNRVNAKLILEGTITTTSPLLIGKGKGDEADTEVMRLPDGRPYIPASSLAGALWAAYIKKFGEPNVNDLDAEAFWGSRKMKKTNGEPRRDTSQSHLIIDDLMPNERNTPQILIRDGVSIDPRKGTALEQGKYDYEIVEPGLKLLLRMEVTVREGMDMENQVHLLKSVAGILKSDDFRIGALTNFGFGCFDLEKCNGYQFTFPDDADNWFEYLETGHLSTDPVFTSGDIKKITFENTFRITAQFKLKSALITGSYGIGPNEPDKAQLASNGKPVLSGKAIKGALRHRTLKILNTIRPDHEKENHQLIDHLMGWVHHKNDPYKDLEKPQRYKKKAIRSRLRVEETKFDDSVVAMTQDRIKIDRFTGGVLGNAKFDSQPIWQKDDESSFSLSFCIQEYKKWEAALLLQLLKDLWTEDLPIGGEKNVGRGVLIGESAMIEFNDITANIKRHDDGLSGDLSKLKDFNTPLSELIEKK